jgi:quinoprotein glucose dehydrogenase
MAPNTFVRRRLAALAAAVLCGFAGAQEAPRTIQERVYTAEQAERGKLVYKRVCADCHALDWYTGETMKPWDGAPLSDLYDLIAKTMPQNNPGSLKRRENLDILAYILSLNEMPPGGSELPAQPEALKKILIKWRKKS